MAAALAAFQDAPASGPELQPAESLVPELRVGALPVAALPLPAWVVAAVAVAALPVAAVLVADLVGSCSQEGLGSEAVVVPSGMP